MLQNTYVYTIYMSFSFKETLLTMSVLCLTHVYHTCNMYISDILYHTIYIQTYVYTMCMYASHLRRLLLTMSILCLTHVDACLVPSHSRAKVEQVLDKIYHQVGFLKREKKHMHIVIVYNRKKKKTEKLIQCDTSRPFSYGILIWFKTISFNTRINF